MQINIRPMQDTAWEAVKRIYQEGIETGNATFQTTVPAWDEWHQSHLQVCRYIAENKASISLHQQAGFSIVGVRSKLGKLNQVWRDVVLMERRSQKI